MAPCRKLFALAVLVLNFSLSRAAEPGACPEDDGKWRTTKSGKTWKILCNRAAGVTESSRNMRPNFGACIDTGATMPGIIAVEFNMAEKSCLYLSATPKGTEAKPGWHHAYINDKPAEKTSDKPVDIPADKTADKPIVKPTDKPVDNQGPGPGPTDPNIKVTKEPSCPESDGRAYVGNDGTYYKIQCGFHTAGTELAKLSFATFPECMNKCTETNGCISVAYIGKPVSPYILYECVLSTGEGPGKEECAHWFAYTIDPPATAEDKPFPYTLCETTCPLSDGMIFESDSGENFKMSCGKRHGTKVLWTQTMETFDECMDACGKILACHSVDYQARTKKCYFGNHHGEPSIPAPGFSSATSMGCSGACKKSCSCPAGAK